MKNILIFAGIAGIAAAIAIYFVGESYQESDQGEYVSDAEMEAYDVRENTGNANIIS